MQEFDADQFKKDNYLRTTLWVTYTHTFRIDEENSVRYTLYVGEDCSFCSVPKTKTLPLNQYEVFIITLDKNQLFFYYEKPSHINEDLLGYDHLFNNNVGKLAKDTALALYESLSNLYEKKTFYCKECGIQLYQEKDMCWACENGI